MPCNPIAVPSWKRESLTRATTINSHIMAEIDKKVK